jgi:hypothetical protein
MRTTPLPERPRRNTALVAGDFWAIPLSDGRFGCGRVLGLPAPGAHMSVLFVAGVHDWVGSEPPRVDSIAGAALLEVGFAHVNSLTVDGCRLVGHRDLTLDGIVEVTDSGSYWGDGFATSRTEHRFVKGDPPPRYESRDIASPLTAEMLQRFTSPEQIIQFESRLTDDDFRMVGEWLHDQPDVHLRAYGSYDGSITDLEFLRHFPNVRRFSADALYDSLTSLDGLRHLRPDLASLTIGRAKAKLDLRVLSRFGELRDLYVEGHNMGIETISRLTSLEELTLRSITLPDLSLLLPLRDLRALDLKLGGTRNLGLLPEIGQLEYLELWMIKGLNDVSMVSRIPSLRFVFLQSLAQVTELPSLADNSALRVVHLETMRGLRDLTPVAAAPGLEALLVIDCSQFRLEHFEPFVGHPTLKSARIGTGSRKRNEAIRALLGLDDADRAYWRDV